MSASSSHRSTPISTIPAAAVDTRTTSHPAHKLLSRAHSDNAEKATKIFTDKVINKPLLLGRSADHDDKRVLRRHTRDRKKEYARKHARPRPLSAKEKRKLNLYKLKPEECRYGVYKGLNTLWRRYVLEVLGYVDREGRVTQGKIGQGVNGQAAGALMASADFHGMEVEVVRCKDAGRVGLKGMVVRETRSTMTLVCDEKEDKRKCTAREDEMEGINAKNGDKAKPRDKVRMIMKKGSVFRVTIDLPGATEEASGKMEQVSTGIRDEMNGMLDQATSQSRTKRQLVFELHGDQLQLRPIERAVKKFKWKPMGYL